MFERDHHQRIARLLEAMDGTLMVRCRCYFGGGTAIVLALDEYRESLDVDFLCASTEGYRTLRGIAFNQGIGGFFSAEVSPLRELRADQYGVRTFLSLDDVPVRFEIVREARIPLRGRMVDALGVPRLTRADLFASKLLANADRFADSASAGRDIIDLAMMVNHWGPIPESAWLKARKAYGDTVTEACAKAVRRMQDPDWMRACLEKLKMDTALLPVVQSALEKIGDYP